MFPAIAFPNFDPVLLEIGPLQIRWYALSYIVGLVGAWFLIGRMIRYSPRALSAERLDDYLVWATLGVVIGGRLGFVIFYGAGYFLENPGEIFMIWQGGMSFHGGLIGVVGATWLFARKHGLNFLAIGDLGCAVAPLGLFFGRLANFINGELYGRVTDVPWAVIFPDGGPWPRHPSQLYEAALEGLLLLAVMLLLWRRPSFRERPGNLTGAFLIGYGLARIFAEIFREPDAHIGNLALGTTYGQWLSVPMVAIGLWLIYGRRNTEAA